MKYTGFILILCLAGVILNSCNSHLRLERRKYNCGFYVGMGKTELRNLSDGPSTNGLQTTAEPNCAENNSVPEYFFCADTIPAVLLIVKADSVETTTTNKNTITSSTLNQQFSVAPNIPEADDEQEQKNIRRASILSLVSYVLMVASLISLIASPVAFAIILTVAFACGIAGMVIARRVRRSHAKGEKYRGRWKMICARLVGILAILFAGITLIVLLGSSVN